MKRTKDERKVIVHLAMNGKFKRCNEIEMNNNRVNKAVKKLIKEEEIIKDEKGYIDFNYKKNPKLREFIDIMRKHRSDAENKVKAILEQRKLNEVVKALNEVVEA